MARPIIVGYDGSRHGAQAVTWAAREAARVGAPLCIVHAEHTLVDGYIIADRPLDLASRVGERVLARGTQRAHAVEPDIEVTTQLELHENAAATLVRESGRARLLVVGSRGRGGFAGLLLGSVGIAVATHASCPVVVVRGRHPSPSDPIVVGVDGSALSTRAVDFAFDEASRLGVPLLALHAWEPPSMIGQVPPWRPVEIEELRVAEKVLVAEGIAGHAERYPDVEVEPLVRRGAPASVLLEAAASAQMLVVGSRGMGGFRGLLLGSVGHAALHHAPCPVVVVHPDQASAAS